MDATNYLSVTELKAEEVFAEYNGRLNEKDLINITERLHKLGDNLVAMGISKEEMKHIACREGCGTCCSLHVAVLFPEALTVYRHIKKYMTVPEYDSIMLKVSETATNTKWVDEEERIHLRQKCPFLSKKNSCLVHKTRPIKCRSITSIDPQDCINAMNPAPLDDESRIIVNITQKVIYDKLFRAFACFLENKGYDDRGFELSQTIDLIHKDPEVINRYLNFEQIRSDF